jgi:hypothetical protein
MRPGEFHDGIESGWIADGKFAEHFAIEFNSSGYESRDEAIVINPFQSKSGA